MVGSVMLTRNVVAVRKCRAKVTSQVNGTSRAVQECEGGTGRTGSQRGARSVSAWLSMNQKSEQKRKQ